MGAAARVTKRRRGPKVDRISSLPDAVLCHILSFLPTKFSVRTRILSTRWKYLFTYVPVLNFESLNCHENKKFIEFVNRVLQMYNFPQMSRFCLVCSYWFPRQPDKFVTWILYALRHKVQELDISVTLDDPISIPGELFFSETLSVLKLQGDFCFDLMPSSGGLLPSLKTLELISVSFDIPAQRILSICPALEDLFLNCCGFDPFGNENVLDITHTGLRKLRIEGFYGSKLILNVPSLVRFEFLNSDISGFRGGNALTSLVEAVIDPCLNMDSADFVQLLNVVSHARRLLISTIPTSAIYGYVNELPTFHKLTRLEVGEVSLSVFELLAYFLNRCSILEVLIFPEGFSDKDFEYVDIDEIMKCYNNVPSCVLLHLKEIEFGEFTFVETVWKLVEYFLKNAQVLREMKIQPYLGGKRHYKQISKKLSTFSRFSKDCQIVIGCNKRL